MVMRRVAAEWTIALMEDVIIVGDGLAAQHAGNAMGGEYLSFASADSEMAVAV